MWIACLLRYAVWSLQVKVEQESVACYLLLLCIIVSIIVVFGEKTRVKFWLCQKIIVPLHSQFENGVWRSPVARLVWDQVVAGSNPVAPTSFRLQQRVSQLRNLNINNTNGV